MTRGPGPEELRQRARDPSAPAGRCCGEHAHTWKGKPYVLACRLCPKSPTYWRAASGEAVTDEP